MNEYGVLVEWHWDQKNRSTHRKPCLSATLSIRNATWTGLGSNLGPATTGWELTTRGIKKEGGGKQERENEREGGVTLTKVVWLSPMWILLLETCLPNEISQTLTMTVEGTMAHSSTGINICMGSPSCQRELSYSQILEPFI